MCTWLLCVFFLFFLRRSFALVTQAGVQWCNLSSLQPLPPSSSNSHASDSQVTGITGTHHHTWLIFVFLVEMRFYRVGQADLELLTLGDLPALASQSAGMIGMSLSHCAQPHRILLTIEIPCGFTYELIWKINVTFMYDRVTFIHSMTKFF